MAARAAELPGCAGVEAVDLARVRPDRLRRVVSSNYVSVIFDSRLPSVRDSLPELTKRVHHAGVTPEFTGWSGEGYAEHQPVAIARGPMPPPIEPSPADFKVVALIPAYNEEDVIETAIAHLIANGVQVYLLDNWSSDRTLERARRFEEAGLIGYEQFPPEGPPSTFDLTGIMTRIEELAKDLDVDWITVNDADELRTSPWPGVSLRDALHHVQQEGFTTVNYTALYFALTADTYRYGSDLSDHLTWFRPDPGGPFKHLKTWRRHAGVRPELAWNGGHEVRFPGRASFPYNFQLRHYPIRSLDQGKRKIFQERIPRFPAHERAKGWHAHYDGLDDAGLLQTTDGLTQYTPDFDERFLLERLAGALHPSIAASGPRARVGSIVRRSGLVDRVLRGRRTAGGRP